MGVCHGALPAVWRRRALAARARTALSLFRRTVYTCEQFPLDAEVMLAPGICPKSQVAYDGGRVRRAHHLYRMVTPCRLPKSNRASRSTYAGMSTLPRTLRKRLSQTLHPVKWVACRWACATRYPSDGVIAPCRLPGRELPLACFEEQSTRVSNVPSTPR